MGPEQYEGQDLFCLLFWKRFFQIKPVFEVKTQIKWNLDFKLYNWKTYHYLSDCIPTDTHRIKMYILAILRRFYILMSLPLMEGEPLKPNRQGSGSML